MRKTVSIVGTLIALSAGIPAAATIQIFSTPGAIQPAENVLLNSGLTGLTVLGSTNQTNTSVTFTGTEALTEPSSGQARITAVDGGLSSLAFRLTDPTMGFKQVEFNIFGTGATATSVTLNFTDQFNTVFSGTFAIGSGQNFFSANALDNQFIKNVSFQLNGDVQDVRQVRVGGFGSIAGSVPEPATWALLMIGMGMVGASARRRRSNTVAA